MTQAVTLKRIGAQVSVDVDQVKDRIPASLLKQLKENPRGRIADYKMTDGQGIGLVLELSDGTTSWFFGEEIIRS